MITDAPYTLCDSCGCYYEATGDITHEKPHRADVNTEPGTCASCEAILTARGLQLIDERVKQILSGGTSDGDEVGSVDTERDASVLRGGNIARDGASHLVSPVKPVQFRPAAQINFEKAA